MNKRKGRQEKLQERSPTKLLTKQQLGKEHLQRALTRFFWQKRTRGCIHGALAKKSTAAMCQVKGWNPLTSIPRTNLRGLFGGKPSHRVAVDWFNTTYLAGRGVPQCNKDALLKLSAHGFDLLLLSYCGWQRDQEVRAAAKALGWQKALCHPKALLSFDKKLLQENLPCRDGELWQKALCGGEP